MTLTKDKQEIAIKRAHVALMKHPETALYSGVMLMGTTAVVDAPFTAYTDGVNKKYGRAFLETIGSESKKRGLVLHENLHVALKQVIHGKAMFKEHPKMANLAADFVVNDIIENIKGTVGGTSERIVELPDGAVYDQMFHNWSMREVFRYLKQNAKPKQNPQGGKGGKGQKSDDQSDGNNNPQQDGSQDKPEENDWESVTVNGKTYDLSQQDVHDFDELMEGMSHEEAKELMDGIDRALREGGMLAGRMGAKIPRVIGDLLEPKVDWREALRDFVNSTTKGKDEFTWRRMNKRHMANDIYMPSVENETIGEIVVAIDTSGSIGGKELSEFATELASICDLCSPEQVRVLWWDTRVHGEQIFKDDYSNIAGLLKPLGGGGTHVGCVSEYINKESLNPECVIVFTDGYVESNVQWSITCPTLWMVTLAKDWIPPTGKKVLVDNDD